MHKKSLIQSLKFVGTGGVGLLVIVLMTHVGVTAFHLWYFFAYTIATPIGWTCMFIANALITFPDEKRGSMHVRYAAFLFGYSIIALVNVGAVFMLTSVAGVHYAISIGIASVLTLPLTFAFNKYVVYG